MLKAAAILIILLGFASAYETPILPEVHFEIIEFEGFRVYIHRKWIPEITNFEVFGKIHYGYRYEVFNGVNLTANGDQEYFIFESESAVNMANKIEYVAYFEMDCLGYFKKVTTTPKELREVNKGDELMRNEFCVRSITEVVDKNDEYCVDDLLYEENFDSNPSNFVVQRRLLNPKEKEHGFMYYDNSAVKIEDGKLKIKPTINHQPKRIDLVNGCTGKLCEARVSPMVSSGKISSSFKFKYGKIVIRASLPKGDWIYPDFNLDSLPQSYTGIRNDYRGGAIRIALVRGNSNLTTNSTRYDRTVLEGGILLDKLEKCLKPPNIVRHEKGIDWTEGYHDYGAIWKEDSIQFMVDNEVYGEVKAPPNNFKLFDRNCREYGVESWKHQFAPFDKPMTLSIGLGIGGPSVFPDTKGKPWLNNENSPIDDFHKYLKTNKIFGEWENEMKVEYVKIWAV